MKNVVFTVVVAAALAAPLLSFSCPPPPCPGYDGPGVGNGPDPGAEVPDYVENGGDDTEEERDVPPNVIRGECNM